MAEQAGVKKVGLVQKVAGKSLIADTEISKLSGIESGANNYTHPSSHSPGIITQDASNRFVSDTEKSTWNGKSDLTLTQVKSDSDIADSLTKKHSNSLDHTSGTDQGLDAGGTNAVTAAQSKAGYTHSGVAHAPSGATVGADWNTNLTNIPSTFTPAAHNQDANTITTGTLDGDRLPAISTTKKGAVPLTGTPSGKFLKDDNTWAAPTASVAITEVEIDCGATPLLETIINVVNAGITAASKIIGGLAYKAPTGKDLDELEMDALDLKFEPLSGSFNVHIKGLEGYIAGTFIIWYLFA